MNIPQYRAWHKRIKKMQKVLDINLDPEFGGVFVWGKAYVDYDTGEHEADKDFWSWSDIELMQYTEAKDDNKEAHKIYDGDIVQTMTMWSEEAIARVLWGDVHPMDRWHSGPTWLLHFKNGLEGPLYPYCDYRNGYTVKVIGNIYENPELLEHFDE